MSGRDDEAVGDQGPAAEEQPVQGHGRLPRVLADVRFRAADDPPVVAPVAVPKTRVVVGRRRDRRWCRAAPPRPLRYGRAHGGRTPVQPLSEIGPVVVAPAGARRGRQVRVAVGRRRSAVRRKTAVR